MLYGKDVMKTASPLLKDLWSKSAEYRAECLDEVGATVQLLNLAGATSLADVGCGSGTFSIAAARAFPHLKIFAFDALESAITEYQADVTDLPRDQFTIGVAPAENLPIPNATVDRVLCRAVLHHIVDPKLLHAELARILKPGGELLLQAPCNFWQPHWSQFISDLYMLMDDSHRRQYHTPATVIGSLGESGLLMHRADCWTYSMNNLNEKQVALICNHNAEQRVRLRQSETGQWSAELYWLRILAQKF
jgi:SAM-dependent methyltransferase